MNTLSAENLKEQGIALFMQHDYEAANRVFQQAKDTYSESNDYDMVAEMKVNIGLVHRSLDENQQALELMQEALAHFKDTNDELRMAQVLGNLGGVYQSLNDMEKAELSFRQAANIFKDLGQETMYSDTLMALGLLLFKDGQFLAGATTYQTAVENRENLTFSQKIIKSLTGIFDSLNGTNS